MLSASGAARDVDLDPRLDKAEQDRIALIEKIKAPVLAVLAPGGQGGGSGEIITDDGYAVTNFHVAAAVGSYFHCGMANGEMYDAVLVGLDRPGDLALIKLIQKPNQTVKFPAVTIGDSDQVKPGDMTVALGNPLLLATDFNPTATFGMVSGVHRYQKIPHPAGTLLEYCDCIQVDTAINPGNSGGPLFNMKGEWIGINSAGSLGKSDRINSGAAYSISVNMVKNFLGESAGRPGVRPRHARRRDRSGERGRRPGRADRQPAGGRLRGGPPRPQPRRHPDLLRRPADDEHQPVQEPPRHLPQGLARADGLPPRRDGAPRGAGAPARPDGRGDRRTSPAKLAGPGAPPDDPDGPAPLPPPPADTDASKLFDGQARLRQLLFQQIGARRVCWTPSTAPATSPAARATGRSRPTARSARRPSSAEIAVRPPAKDQKNEQIAATHRRHRLHPRPARRRREAGRPDASQGQRRPVAGAVPVPPAA